MSRAGLEGGKRGAGMAKAMLRRRERKMRRGRVWSRQLGIGT